MAGKWLQSIGFLTSRKLESHPIVFVFEYEFFRNSGQLTLLCELLTDKRKIDVASLNVAIAGTCHVDLK